MNARTERFRTSYESAFEDYLHEASESTLRAAYELGREAVRSELSVLDLAVVHHDALRSALNRAFSMEDVGRVTAAAADFFVEGLSAFEMVQRGFREAQEAALLERRHAAILRRLSNFLADASIALHASDSVEEMLRLVAEQARELTNANSSIAWVAQHGREGRTIEAASHAEPDRRSNALRKRLDVPAVESLVRSSRSSVRMSPEEVSRHFAGRLGIGQTPSSPPRSGLLAAPLTALDGHRLGSIVAFDKDGDEFTEADEAVLAHLAQMAAAALERLRLYEHEA